MHFIISWENKASLAKRGYINRRVKECLDGYSWVRPLSGVYIIKVASEVSRLAIIEKMKGLAKANPTMLYFVASPLMRGGKYRGWLPKKYWPMIDKRVQDVGQNQ